MGYEYITKYDSPNFTRGRQGRGIKEIVIHHWGIMGQSYENIINWLCNPKAKVSAHYVVEAGKVACLVDLSNTAWHAGNFYHNTISIGIECRPEARDSDYETVGELVAKLWKEYGKLPLIRHKDIVPTDCPGKWDLEKIKRIAEKYYSGKTETDNSSKQVSTPQSQNNKGKNYNLDDIAKRVINGEFGNGSDRVQRLKNSGYNCDEVQKRVNEILSKDIPTPQGKNIDELAREVINGKWGNGMDRVNRLKSAGYDYNAVQRRVNEMLS